MRAARCRCAAAGVLGAMALAASAVAADEAVVRVGSKSFTESYILGEIVAQLIEHTGEARAERRLGLGGTGIIYRALTSGDVDIYVEYTGTISRVILKDSSVTTVGSS